MVKPGLTGLAQIHGRNLASWQEKFKWDLEYIENISFKLDVSIFFKTIVKVLKKGGISGNGVETAGRFDGTEEKIR